MKDVELMGVCCECGWKLG